jgi:hypothetical protein
MVVARMGRTTESSMVTETVMTVLLEYRFSVIDRAFQKIHDRSLGVAVAGKITASYIQHAQGRNG